MHFFELGSYKNSGATDEDKTAPARVNTFNSKFSKELGGLQEDEKVPEGSFGSFIARDRPNLSERVGKLEQQNQKLEQQNQHLQEQMSNLKKLNLLKLQNLTVQLAFSIQKKFFAKHFRNCSIIL